MEIKGIWYPPKGIVFTDVGLLIGRCNILFKEVKVGVITDAVIDEKGVITWTGQVSDKEFEKDMERGNLQNIPFTIDLRPRISVGEMK